MGWNLGSKISSFEAKVPGVWMEDLASWDCHSCCTSARSNITTRIPAGGPQKPQLHSQAIHGSFMMRCLDGIHSMHNGLLPHSCLIFWDLASENENSPSEEEKGLLHSWL